MNTTQPEKLVREAQHSAMAQAQQRWAQMFYAQTPPYSEGLQLAGAVASETARLATVELCGTVSGGQRGAFLQQMLSPVLREMRRQTELAAALGTVVIKPYTDGTRLAADFVLPQNFVPLAVRADGEITDAIFLDRVHQGARWFTRMERHTLCEEGYTVANTAYASASAGVLGAPCALGQVEAWRGLPPSVTLARADGAALQKPLFTLLRMPFANTVDAASPFGVSVFARAENLLREADKHYHRILWEYEGSELAVDASVGALQGKGRDFKLPHAQQRLFRQLALDGGAGGDLYSVFSPAIRDESLFNGLNQLLRRIECNCHLSYGTLSDVQTQEKTAAEVKMSRQRSYSAVCEVQKQLTDALERTVEIMNLYADLYRLAPPGEITCAFTCGDAVLQDTDTLREQLRRDCAQGLAQPWEYRVRFYGETPAQAKQALENASVMTLNCQNPS